MCNAAEMQGSFKSLDAVRERFSELGFKIPALEVERVESVRERPSDERSFAYYSKERLLEALSFPSGRWRRSDRERIELTYRSQYLDILCNKTRSPDLVFGDDNADEPRVYEEMLNREVDPNYLRYLRLDVRDGESSTRVAREVGAALSSEVRLFENKLKPFLNGVRTISAESVTALFAAIAKDAGIPVLLDAHRSEPKIVLRVPLRNGCALYLDWRDDLVLKKWGRLQIAFTLDRADIEAGPPVKFSPQAPRFGLGAFIPGGDWYTRPGDHLLRTALCIFAHIEFLRLHAEVTR